MYASIGARARRQPPDNARRIVLLVVIAVLFATVAVGLASAELPSRTVRVSAESAAQSGSLVGMAPRAVADSALLEIKPGDSATRLLAVAPDGAQVALADRVGELFGSLTLAKSDGSQVRVSLPGLLGAGYAADGTWLAVLDGRGVLWQVDSASGEARQLAEGPFLGTPIAGHDGSLMLLSVPSVEAPYRSLLVRFVPSSGSVTTLASDDLVYAGYPLDDGTLALVAHRAGGTVVKRVGPGVGQVLADLGPGAINAAVASDGRHIAFEKAGQGIFLVDGPGAPARSIGLGSRPCFAPDASTLLVHRDNDSAALSVDGSLLAVTARLTGVVGSAGCLP
jgi:hypothetical protein